MLLTTMEKAIATIQAYCQKHQCYQCKYSAYDTEKCLFQRDVPCDWVEEFEKMQNEAEEDDDNKCNVV